MKYKRYFISLVLILAMVSIAEITGEREIIFPEIAALVVGAWILEKQPWKVSKLGLVCLMTLCSIVGVLIVRYVNLGLTIEVLIGLVFTGLILKLSKTTLVPIISACILPIVLRTETWVYPISVFILTILIVSIKYFIEDYGVSEEVSNLTKEKNIEIASMEEGFNYNKESISLNAKKVENSKEGMIFATVDNIKLAVLSEEAYDSAINLSNIEDCRVEILNLIDSEKENKKEVKKLVKRLKPLVIIDDLDNGKSIEKLGVKDYKLNEEKGLKIMRVLGENKEFKVLSKKEGYTSK